MEQPLLRRRTTPAAGESTPIIVGAKNFTEQYVLGQLYKQALEAKGLSVRFLESIGSTELIAKALTSGQITLYPEYEDHADGTDRSRRPSNNNATTPWPKRLWGRRGTMPRHPDALPGPGRSGRAQGDRVESTA